MNDVIWSFMEMKDIICAFVSSQVDKCTKIDELRHKHVKMLFEPFSYTIKGLLSIERSSMLPING